MNVLIVYAHPEPTSFTGALKDAARRALVDAGHTVEVSDLYAENFNPVASRHDFTTVHDEKRFHYQGEQVFASRNHGFAPDLEREQQRVMSAQMFLFLFPLWWGGMPAILKGWFDRVLAYGFAYADGQRYESGFFRGRRALIGLTTGGTAHRFTPDGTYGDMSQVLHGVQHCMLEYLGFDSAAPFVAYATPRISDEQRSELLKQWEARVLELISDPLWQQEMKAREGVLLESKQRDACVEGSAWSIAR